MHYEDMSPKALLARAVQLEAAADRHEATAKDQRREADKVRQLAAEKDAHT